LKLLKTPASPIHIVYCSWSEFKKEEWGLAQNEHKLISRPDRKLGELFALEFRNVSTQEPLLCDLEQMIRSKAESAYRAVRTPCIVEHAGLILEGYEGNSYPGGLTQPMWDALGAERFVASCAPLATRAIARAVIGYCDGMSIQTFIGETAGVLSPSPRGDRAFYWDTVFCPDGFGDRTYAEIAAGGLSAKLSVSQSIKALKGFMEYRLSNEPSLFPGI
jgi:inosine/xanthosine triphosphate pyrophosphatase family protein